jgi:beta-phosphoglucomutase-like phosphatase (HAD superfamily)
MIKAIVFDMDGVLIDAREWHFEALNKALQMFGMQIPHEQHLTTFDGLPTSKKLELLTESQGLPRGLHGLINKLKQAFTADFIQLKCRPTFAHEYALSKLAREGYQLAVASNSIRKTIEMMMDKANLQQFLEFTLSNEDVTLAKPNPEIYLLAIRKLGLLPDEVLVVEDNENGIRAAEASGAHVLVVESPSAVTYRSLKEKINEIDSGV